MQIFQRNSSPPAFIFLSLWVFFGCMENTSEVQQSEPIIVYQDVADSIVVDLFTLAYIASNSDSISESGRQLLKPMEWVNLYEGDLAIRMVGVPYSGDGSKFLAFATIEAEIFCAPQAKEPNDEFLFSIIVSDHGVEIPRHLCKTYHYPYYPYTSYPSISTYPARYVEGFGFFLPNWRSYTGTLKIFILH